MKMRIPEYAEKYAESPKFTTETVPKQLTKSHDTKQGIWGKLIVLQGALDYKITGSPETSMRIEAKSHAVIEPQISHRVRLDSGTCFFIEFYRERERDG